MKYSGGLTEAPTLGAYLPHQADIKPCPRCAATPLRVWRPGGAFHQRTECVCGRVTVWVVCGHDAVANSDDDTPEDRKPDPLPSPYKEGAGGEF